MNRARSGWLSRTASVGLLSVFSASTVAAQALPAQHTGDRGAAAVSLMDSARELIATERLQPHERQSDSVLNGALIGAGVAVASGLLFCTTMEPWENCRDDVGPMLKIGALGAGIGIAVDALIRGRRTDHATASGAAEIHAAPVVGLDARGLKLSVRF
jgi:hypothetical protein